MTPIEIVLIVYASMIIAFIVNAFAAAGCYLISKSRWSEVYTIVSSIVLVVCGVGCGIALIIYGVCTL